MKAFSELRRAAEAIRDSDFLLITAGAGMGVDSGLPDFRGPQGFWQAYPPISKLGLTFPETSNPTWFHKNPHFIWAFFGHRYSLYKSSIPHPGFKILQSWCKAKEFFVFTSNVDGQFQKSGFSEDRIVECHGSIHYLQCSEHNLCTLDIWPMESIQVDMEKFRALEPLPGCINCGKVARPNILMFGDYGWIKDRTESQMAKLNEKLAERKWKICVIELGAGEAVYTVRGFGEHFIHRERATLVRINPEKDWETTSNIIRIESGALEGLQNLEKELIKLTS